MYQPTKQYRRNDDTISVAAATLLNLADQVQGLFRFIADAVLSRAFTSFRQERGILKTIWRRVGFSLLYYILFLALMSNTRLFGRIAIVWRRLRITSLPGQNDL